MSMKVFLISQKVGQQIAYYRKLNGLTLEQLSKVVHVSQQQQSRYEKGINRINIENLKTYSRFFNVDIIDFFSLSHNEDNDNCYIIVQNNKNSKRRFK